MLDPENNTGIALPPSPKLRADLSAPWFSMSGDSIKVASREEIIKKIGRSPDFGSACILALMDTPKVAAIRAISPGSGYSDGYDPFARM